MPTGACRPEWGAEDRNEEGRPQSRKGADSLTDRPGGYRPPSAQECQIADVQKWLDLCA
jgi:hypothetical protein